ncbi:CLUMA_CG017657, isoform A [Clunio marinus]|uniref:CLUMA_CG017657, isoform A n=1 Tax=Clunio marinus TaxID=568069 RepID=A0A1J1IWJ7_9DIPT|nr:CLUMA_CG017657, isoform A [Clunio marinus]
MAEISISPKAYIKMIFHAAKYPHLAVNGLLLGVKGNEKSKVEVVDAIPLFHQCLYVSPMSEVALVQVESRASSEGLQIIGYYAAAENFYDNTIEKAPGLKIAEKIVDTNGSAYVIMMDNKSICMDMKHPGIKSWQSNDGKWTKVKHNLIDSRHTLDAVSLLLQRGAMKEIYDFDNYLDNVDDWTNQHLNVDLKQILSMH